MGPRMAVLSQNPFCLWGREGAGPLTAELIQGNLKLYMFFQSIVLLSAYF